MAERKWGITYVEALQKLTNKMMGLVSESLGLGATYLSNKMDEGMQIMAVNNYPPCLTLALQIFDSHQRTWMEVPVGDQLEVLSNGRYKSALHRVVLSTHKSRISIAILLAMGMDVRVGPAPEMVDEEHPNGYRESSFGDFLDFISNSDLGQGRGFLETLKIIEK